MALLKLPRLYLLTLSVSTEFDFDAAGAQEGSRSARRVLLRAKLVPLDSPRLGKLVHVKLEMAVASHGVISFVAVVVSAKTAEASTQMGGCHNLYETVAVPGDLKTCDGCEFEQVSVQVDVHPGSVIGQGDTGVIPPDCEVLVKTEDQTSKSDLD